MRDRERQGGREKNGKKDIWRGARKKLNRWRKVRWRREGRQAKDMEVRSANIKVALSRKEKRVPIVPNSTTCSFTVKPLA